MKKRIFYFAVLSLFLIFSNTYIFAQDGKIPFEFLDSGHILIRAVVEDSINGNFVFDTGAGIHAFSKKFSDRINKKNTGFFTAFRSNGERLGLDIYTISSIGIGNTVERNPYICVWEALDNLGIDGIISLKLFEKQPFTLNFINKTIIVESPESLEKLSGKGITVPLELQVYRDKAIDIFAKFRLNDKVTAELEIDTGAGKGILIDARYMKILGIDSTSASVKKIESKSITGVSEISYKTSINKIVLSGSPGISLSNPSVTFEKDLIYDGLIGVEFMLDKEVTIDIPGKRMIINTVN
ncbi:hypothetical protein ACFL4T_14635 [candidate division KSB1 bacterium]